MRYVARLDRRPDGRLQATLVARYVDETPVVMTREAVASCDRIMNASRVGTLWSVEAGQAASLDVPSLPRAATRTSLLSGSSVPVGGGGVKLAEALRRQLEDARLDQSPILNEPAKKGAAPRRTEKRSEGAGKPPIPHTTLAPAQLEVTRCSRLRTGLRLETPSEDLGRLMRSEGVPFGLAAAPDYFAVGGSWAHSSQWIVEGGRLKAPREAHWRIFETFDLGRSPSRFDVMGVTVLDIPDHPTFVGYADWRSDEQIFDDAADEISSAATVASLGDHEAVAAVLATLKAQGSRKAFEVDSLVEAARRRGRLSPALAEAIAVHGRLREAIEIELRERRSRMIEALETEINDRRRLLEETLEDRRRTLSEAEARLATVQAIEGGTRHAVAVIKDDVAETVERGLRNLRAEIEKRLHETQRDDHRAEEHRLQIEAIGRTVANLGTVLAETRVVVTDEREEVRRLRELFDGSEEAARRKAEDGERPQAPAIAPANINDRKRAASAIDEAAAGWNVAETALRRAAILATNGYVPLLAGPRGAAAALALADAMTGGDHGVVHCDPSLLSAGDLLDARTARSHVLVDVMERAREAPGRWHAIALLNINWSPCGYWLPAMSRRHDGPRFLPPNLAVVASLAADGDTIAVPASAAAHAVPVVAEPHRSPSAKRNHGGAWSVGAVPNDGGDATPFAGAFAAKFAPASPAAMATAVPLACTGWALATWTAEVAAEELRPIVGWLTAHASEGQDALASESFRRYLKRGKDD